MSSQMKPTPGYIFQCGGESHLFIMSALCNSCNCSQYHPFDESQSFITFAFWRSHLFSSPLILFWFTPSNYCSPWSLHILSISICINTFFYLCIYILFISTYIPLLYLHILFLQFCYKLFLQLVLKTFFDDLPFYLLIHRSANVSLLPLKCTLQVLNKSSQEWCLFHFLNCSLTNLNWCSLFLIQVYFWIIVQFQRDYSIFHFSNLPSSIHFPFQMNSSHFYILCWYNHNSSLHASWPFIKLN